MPYNDLVWLFVLISVAYKMAAFRKVNRLSFKKTTRYYPLEYKPLPSLFSCLLMDFIGSAVTFIPFIGEFIWAPISAFIFWRMFGFRKGFLGGVFSFVEELIPGIDFIPTFTIMWFIQYARRKKEQYLARPLVR